MRRPIYLLILVFFMISCPGSTWVATPSPSADYLKCSPNKKMPQMIPIPGFEGAWQVVDRCDLYPREKTAIALRVFSDEWQKTLGSSWAVKRAFRDLLITWRDDTTRHSGYSVDGRKFENAVLRGATMGPGLVYVFQSENGPDRHNRICESALAHELVHAILWRVNGKHGDPDHLGPIYRGWTPDHSAIIQKTNEALCELGI